MNQTLKAQLESILFLHGEPLSIKKLALAIGAEKKEIEVALLELQQEYISRGIRLIHQEGEWQMVTSPECAPIIEKLIKGEFSENLSRAAMETLTIVAYKGPLTRAELEFIRGVNSVYSLRNLMMRGLIEKKDNPKDGRSHIYNVTFEFLRHFGLSKIEELPRYEEFHAAPVPEIILEEKERGN